MKKPNPFERFTESQPGPRPWPGDVQDRDYLLLQHLAECLGDGVRASFRNSSLIACQDPARKVKRTAQINFAGRATGFGAGVGESCPNPDSEEAVRTAHNAERDLQKTFQRQNLSLPIPIHKVRHTLQTGQKIFIEYVNPSDWLACLISKAPCMLAGGHSGLEDQLAGFWELYRQTHGSHEVYVHHGNDLRRVFPILFFGDEGSGPRRAGYLAATIESCLGLSEVPDQCDCGDCSDLPWHWVPQLEDDLPHETDQMLAAARVATNYKGNSKLTRFLVFGLPGFLYDKNPQMIDKHLQLVSDDLASLFHKGIVVSGVTYNAALVGSKGDLKFQAHKVVHMCRSYANRGTANDIPCCSLCMAGHSAVPMEDVQHEPLWASTMFQQRPWTDSCEPVFSQVPYDQAQPEYLYKLDAFHVFKVGVGRDLTGSTLVFLCDLGCFDLSRALPERLSRAHRQFKLWCMVHGKSPALRSFTKLFLNIVSRASAPWCNSKGSDTMMLLEWLSWYLKLQLRSLEGDLVNHEQMFRMLAQVFDNSLAMFEMSYCHPVFLRRKCAGRLYCHIMTVVRGYKWVAAYMVQEGHSAYRLKPKLHALHHLAYEIRSALKTPATRIMNWLCYACEMNEDHIGHTARLSRVLNTKTLSLRLMQRVFLKTRALMRRHLRARAQEGIPCHR